MTEEQENQLLKAIEDAILEIGLENFKKTSFFMSNHHKEALEYDD